MKVRELIQALTDYDMDYDVEINNNTSFPYPIDNVDNSLAKTVVLTSETMLREIEEKDTRIDDLEMELTDDEHELWLCSDLSAEQIIKMRSVKNDI